MHPDKPTILLILVFINKTWQEGALDARRGFPEISIRVCDESLPQFGRTFEDPSFLSPNVLAALKIPKGQGY
jgi:hypothetical protein